MKFRIPKWATIVGGIVAACTVVLQYVPPIAAVIPALSHNETVMTIIGVAGAIVAAYGTPPHANTVTGGVQLSTDSLKE